MTDKVKWLHTPHEFEEPVYPDWDPTGGPSYCNKCGMEKNYSMHILAKSARAKDAIADSSGRGA